MWFNGNSHGPHFTAIDPDVNPLPACLAKSRPDKYMKQFLPGNFSRAVNDPGFMILPGELLGNNNFYINSMLNGKDLFPDGTPAFCEGYIGPTDRDLEDIYRHGRCLKFNMTEDTWTVISTTPERRLIAILLFSTIQLICLPCHILGSA